MTTTLNPSLALISYENIYGDHDAICFVGDLDQDLTEQAAAYLKYEEIETENFTAYWHNALEDVYGNRYEPKVELVG